MDSISKTSVFSPASGFQKGKKPQLSLTAFAEKIPYYALPDETTTANRLLVARYLAYCGTSESLRLPEWKTWIVTWACLITPAFMGRLPTTTFSKITMGPNIFPHVIQVVTNLENAHLANDREATDESGNAIKALNVMPLLPEIKHSVDMAFGNGEWSAKVALCYYSMVIFLAAKRIENDDHSSINDARPKALRGKAHIPDQLDYLEGELKMSDSSHLCINSSWSEMGQLRSVVFREYALYDDDEADLMKDILWTNVHLMRYANMGHALITYNFLQAYPWAADVPALKTSIGIYLNSLREASKVDQKLFPFIKLIYGDRSGLFPRKDMEPLVACSVAVQKETSSTLADFYTSSTFNPIVDAFLEEKARRDNIRDLGIQKAEKELVDYFGDSEVINTPADSVAEPATDTQE